MSSTMKAVPLLLLALSRCLCSPAVVHSHAHTHVHSHQSHQGEKEHERHGSPPRLQDHYKDGEHLTEFDHEAILGSVKEAEEFDHLPIEESKRRLRLLLVKMDTDGDAHISKAELKDWIMRSFMKLSEEEAAERFEEIDANVDGKITWREYISETYGLENENSIPIDENGSDEIMMKEDKIMFQAADENKDGALNSEEFVWFSNPEEHPKMHPFLLEQTMREKDINNDGKIDFQEFIGDKGIENDKEWIAEEKDKFENDYDEDHNGFLSGKEITDWVIPNNEEIADDEVEHLFGSSDDNHDLRLSFDEIIDHHDLFVGSEATDYGDQLLGSHFEDEL